MRGRLAVLGMAALTATTIGLGVATHANGKAESVSAEAAGAALTYEVDGVHSSVIFGITHLGVSRFYGRFNEISGTFQLDDDRPEDSDLELAVKVDSIDTANANRNDHLKGPDFFNARQFPTITFKSTEVDEAGKDRWKVTGDLTLHGVTKPITVVVEKVGEGKGMRGEPRMGFESRFTVKRSDFGMTYMMGGLGDEVDLIVGIEGVQK